MTTNYEGGRMLTNGHSSTAAAAGAEVRLDVDTNGACSSSALCTLIADAILEHALPTALRLRLHDESADRLSLSFLAGATSPVYEWKVISTLLEFTKKFHGSTASVSPSSRPWDPIFEEGNKTETLPRWLRPNDRIYFHGGVLCAIGPSCPRSSDSPSLLFTAHPAQTRLIPLTEAVLSRIRGGALSNGRSLPSVPKGKGAQQSGVDGVHSVRVSIPVDLAFVARERPDIVSLAIKEWDACTSQQERERVESALELAPAKCLVPIRLNDIDYARVNRVEFADDDSDPESACLASAMQLIHQRYVAQLGAAMKTSSFVSERRNCTLSALRGRPDPIAVVVAKAFSSLPHDHIAQVRRVLIDSEESEERSPKAATSSDGMASPSQPNGHHTPKVKKPPHRRRLAAIPSQRSQAPAPPSDDDDDDAATGPGGALNGATNGAAAMAPPSNNWRRFEDAVNGTHFYKESSSDDLGGAEPDLLLDLQRERNRRRVKRLTKSGGASCKQPIAAQSGVSTTEVVTNKSQTREAQPAAAASSDEDDMAAIFAAAPPLATVDDDDL